MGQLHHRREFNDAVDRLVEAAHIAALDAIAKAMARDEAPTPNAPLGVIWIAAAVLAASGVSVAALLLR